MGDWKRWSPSLIAAAMLIVGLMMLDWVVLESGLGLSLRLAPRRAELCSLQGCAAVPSGQGSVWGATSTIAFGAGLLAALGLIGVTVMRFIQVEPGPFGAAVMWLCVLTTVAAVVAVLATGAGFGELGAGMPATVIGALIGFGARLPSRGSGAFEGGRAGRAIRSTAVVAAPRPSATAGSAPIAADRAVGGVRFVVAGGAIEPTGLVLRYDRIPARRVAWSDIVEVVARRLPPDPPHDKGAFIDLVLATGAPVRLTAASRLDYAGLPGGMAPNTKENWRRLVALARRHHPAIVIEADSAEFFGGGRDAPMFPAFKKFQDWDQRYDADAAPPGP